MKFETLELTPEIRTKSPGQFASLSDGITHYEIGGQESGEPIILVHGFSFPYFVWDFQFNVLAAAGFRVLRYDLYGRGLSDRPVAVYNSDLFDRQLMEIIEAGKFGNKAVTLVGVSMGGAIIINFADHHPERVKRLVLVDPAGFPFKTPAGSSLLKLPGLGNIIFKFLGKKILLAATANNVFNQHLLPVISQKFVDSMQYKGFGQAIVSSMRYFPLNNLADAYRRVGQRTLPIVIFWGKEDKVIPFTVSESVRAALPKAQFYPMEKTGHMSEYDSPEEFNQIFLKFLKST